MRTKAATHAGAKVPPRSPRALYREHFPDARRERLFLSSVAFFLTFAIVRAITYTIHATNNGPSDAQNVVVSDALDSHLTSMGTPTYCVDYGSGCGPSFTWSGSVGLGVLPAGLTVNVVITATVDSSTPQGYNLQNTASITSTTP